MLNVRILPMSKAYLTTPSPNFEISFDEQNLESLKQNIQNFMKYKTI